MERKGVPPPGFRSPSRVVRAACLVGLLGVSGAVLGRVAGLVGLPPGYNRAQSDTARDLAKRTDWDALRAATAKDILLFVPVYVVYGLVVIGVVRPTRSGGRRALLATMVGTGVADVAETLLFRHSLTRLAHHATVEQIGPFQQAARTMTVLKWGLAAATLVHLAIRVVGPAPVEEVRAGR